MSFLFKTKPRAPPDLVRQTKDAIHRIERDPERRKPAEDLAKCLLEMKRVLHGGGDTPPNPEQNSLLAQEIYSQDILPLVVANMGSLDFESRKDVVQILGSLLRRQIGTRFPTVEYLVSKEDTLALLVCGYDNPDIALHCGAILREVAKHEALTKLILTSQSIWCFFRWLDAPAFDLASDAWATFRELLICHKQIAFEFLNANFADFFAGLGKLLESPSYLSRLLSLRLLSEILLERTNHPVLERWTSDADHLKRIMTLLRDKSRGIATEAFGIFKIFVATPDKSPAIADILRKNKERLVLFLGSFADRSDDERLVEEKMSILQQIEAM
ncbi:Mo25-like protein [Hyaloraphidium curvatum]|nr:Mo25-like protein [Hyaloraphidium curvatum]